MHTDAGLWLFILEPRMTTPTSAFGECFLGSPRRRTMQKNQETEAWQLLMSQSLQSPQCWSALPPQGNSERMAGCSKERGNVEPRVPGIAGDKK
jgi:hypothetical protein